MPFYSLLLERLTAFCAACTYGQIRSGEASSAEMQSGGVSSGGVSSGEMSSRQMSHGEMSPGEMSSGAMSSANISSAELSHLFAGLRASCGGDEEELLWMGDAVDPEALVRAAGAATVLQALKLISIESRGEDTPPPHPTPPPTPTEHPP